VNHNIVYLSDNSNPQKTLFALLKNINPFFCIIFCNTKKEAEEIYKKMKSENKNVALLHKDLLPRQRKNVFEDINKNKYQYLVATDLAARGIDIAGADVVISFGLPEDDQ
jgi:ATP-dependent RNA helicase CshB